MSVDVYSNIGQIQVEPGKEHPFAFEVSLYRLPFVAVGAVAISPCAATRTASHAADGNEYDVLGIATGPEIGVEMKGREAFFYGDGAAFLWRGDAAGTSRYAAPETGLLNIAIPRTVLTSAIPDLNRVSDRQLDPSAEFRLLAAYVQAFLDEADTASPHTAHLVAGHIQDLALLALGATGDEAEVARGRGVRAARLKAVKADIEANLASPGLSVDWITARHKVSPRYLRALFADEGVRFTDYVTGRRLALAWRRLTDPALAGHGISDIAYGCGFGDLSWFNRAFRRRFDMTPSEARAGGAVDPGAGRA